MNKSNLDILARKRAIWAFLGIIFLLILVGIFMYVVKFQLTEYDAQITNGIVMMEHESDFSDTIYNLNGEWLVLEGVYIGAEECLSESLDREKLAPIDLPETRLSEVKTAKTYVLNLSLSDDVHENSKLAIAVPFIYKDTKLYLNGSELVPHEPFNSWMGTKTQLQLYLLVDHIENGQEYQELIVTVNEQGNNYGLYRREIMISDVATFYEQMQMNDGIQNLLIGMMIIGILMGWINMLILPHHNMLTSMTLFDTTLMLYFFFGISKLPMQTIYAMTGDSYGELVLRGITLILYCLTGFWGNRISRDIFDPEVEVSPKRDRFISNFWLLGAVINAIIPQYFGELAIIVYLLFYTFTMDILIRRILLCHRKGQYNIVMRIHVYKAIFVGAILGYDIWTINVYPRNNTILLVGYCLFFLLEFLMRANVHKEAFDTIREDKKALAEKIDARTKELNLANENLRELMHMDPLTKAYNRLYFEETLLKEIEGRRSDSKNYHLCLFDLDNFKSINDTYGHQVGDEQLVDAVNATKKVVGDDSVVSRIGGEEFIVLFRGKTDLQAVLFAEKIRLELEKLSSKDERTTGSFGVIRYELNDNRKSAFVRVDQCLYHSKNNGKNCVTYEFTQRKIFDNTKSQL